MPDTFELDLSSPTSCYGFIRDELSAYSVLPPKDTLLRLELSAGTDPAGNKVLRPYKLIGDVLSRTINQKHLNEGEGAKLRDADKTIASWYQEQRALDVALGLTVPPEPGTGVRSKGSFTVRTMTVYD